MKYDVSAAYNALHESFPGYRPQPLIGITGNFGDKGCELAEGYFRSILAAGGVPVVIPPFSDTDALLSLLSRLDGLMLSGGADINPLYLGEEPVQALHGINPKRDEQEMLLVRLAYDRQIPILGICRGIQVMAAALGGTLWQDIYTQKAGGATLQTEEGSDSRQSEEGASAAAKSVDGLLKHSQDAPRGTATHTVTIDEHSTLYNIMRARSLAVNSFHHQAVRDGGPLLRIVATAPDGIVEAVESSEGKSILGVQWHPECFVLEQDDSMAPLFQWLVGEAQSYAQARAIHARILTLDSHEDTPMFFHQGVRFDHRDSHVLVDLHKMHEGGLDAGIMVAYLPQKERDEAALRSATALADDILRQLKDMVEAYPNSVVLARTPDDLYRAKRSGRHAVMMGIENGYAIGRDLRRLEHFRDLGIVYMTLCHNGDNDICDSCRGAKEHGGLSPFGREVVEEMNRLGLMVDLSHAAETTFWDALKASRTPIVCSHSSCRALCDHPRNLTDRQMAALAEAGGVMQVTIYNGFLRTDGKATLDDVVRHIDHAVQIMGIEHVGIGTDFDGDGGVPGVACASELINLTRALLRKGYTEEQLQLLWGENFLRVMRQCQAAAVK